MSRFCLLFLLSLFFIACQVRPTTATKEEAIDVQLEVEYHDRMFVRDSLTLLRWEEVRYVPVETRALEATPEVGQRVVFRLKNVYKGSYALEHNSERRAIFLGYQPQVSLVGKSQADLRELEVIQGAFNRACNTLFTTTRWQAEGYGHLVTQYDEAEGDPDAQARITKVLDAKEAVYAAWLDSLQEASPDLARLAVLHQPHRPNLRATTPDRIAHGDRQTLLFKNINPKDQAYRRLSQYFQYLSDHMNDAMLNIRWSDEDKRAYVEAILKRVPPKHPMHYIHATVVVSYLDNLHNAAYYESVTNNYLKQYAGRIPPFDQYLKETAARLNRSYPKK